MCIYFCLVPAISDIYKKCIVRAEDSDKHDDVDRDFIHPSRLINFLVGVRGKNETMAIGGPWSKKLDGKTCLLLNSRNILLIFSMKFR